MPKFFVTNKDIGEQKIVISNEDVNHIKNVLRNDKLDTLTICDRDTEIDYLCEITQISDKVNCKILNEIESNAESNIKVTIMQGIPKFDKMELIIQKSVELGVYDIIPIKMKRCIVKLDEKDKNKKIQRWQKIAEVAAKQSGRNVIPKINDVKNIKEICNLSRNYDIVLVTYENEEENKLKFELEKLKSKRDVKIAIVIGPEGGIDKGEIKMLQENGAKIVTLGKRILRTETVALNCLSVIMYELEE